MKQLVHILLNLCVIGLVHLKDYINKNCKEIYDSTIGKLPSGDKEYIYKLTHQSDSFNSLGEYDSCVENPSQNYFLASVYGNDYPFQIGLCALNTCSVDYFMSMVESDNNNLKVELSKIFLEDINNKMKVIINNQNKQKDQLQSTILWYYIGIGYFAIINILGILGSYMTFTYNYGKQQLEKTHDEITLLKLDSDQNSDQNLQLISYQKQYENSFSHKFLSCFSIIENTKELIKSESTKNQSLNIFSSIRILFCVNAIYVHTLSYEEQASNPQDISKLYQNFQLLLINISFQTVDTFFMMSGFLQAYVFFIKYQSGSANKIKFYFSSIFQRAVRLWPNLITCIIAFWTIYPYIGDGPNWYHTAKKQLNVAHVFGKISYLQITFMILNQVKYMDLIGVDIQQLSFKCTQLVYYYQ